jgi:hypothetical protein
MTILGILKMVAVIGKILTGLYSLVRPTAVTPFTGLQPTGPRGISEIRSVLGGLYIGLGLAALLMRSAGMTTLGVGYLAIAVVRAVSILVDGAPERSNWISLVIEVVFGLVLVF